MPGLTTSIAGADQPSPLAGEIPRRHAEAQRARPASPGPCRADTTAPEHCILTSSYLECNVRFVSSRPTVLSEPRFLSDARAFAVTPTVWRVACASNIWRRRRRRRQQQKQRRHYYHRCPFLERCCRLSTGTCCQKKRQQKQRRHYYHRCPFLGKRRQLPRCQKGWQK